MKECITIYREGDSVVMEIKDPEQNRGVTVKLPKEIAIRLSAELLHFVFYGKEGRGH